MRRVGAFLLLIAALLVSLWQLQHRSAEELAKSDLSIELLAPWPTPTLIRPRSGAILRSEAGERRLAWVDESGTVHAMLYGSSAFAPLLGVNAQAAPLLATDLDGDGTEDLVFATGDHRLAAYSGESGTRLALADWFAERFYMSPVACRSPDGEQRISGHSAGGKFGLYHGADLTVAGGERYYDGRSLGVSVGLDVNGDGSDDAVTGTERGEVVWLDFLTGKLSVVPVVDRAGPDVSGFPAEQQRFRASITAFDFSGDGTSDWVLLDGLGSVLVFDPVAGKVWAWYDLDSSRSQRTGFPPGPLLADLDADGTPEIIVAHTDGKIYAFQTPVEGQGELETLWTSASTGSALFGPALADLNGDAIPEVVTVREAGDLQVLDGASAEELYRAPLGVRGPPLIDDLDGDGLLEITAASKQSWVVLKTNARARVGMVWSQWRGHQSRLGVYPWPREASVLSPLWAAVILAALLGSVGLWVKS